MNRNMIIGVVVLAVVLIGGFILYQNMQNSAPAPTDAPATTTDQMAPVSTPMATDNSQATASGNPAAATKEFTVIGSNFKFAPSTLTVNKGDTVKITFQNAQGIHDFVLPDFNVQSKQIGSGQSDTVTFTANKTGSFQYFCSVGNHKALGMEGTLIVQ